MVVVGERRPLDPTRIAPHALMSDNMSSSSHEM